MNDLEEELNPAPKSYRPSFTTKALFLSLAILGIFGYAYMVKERRSAQSSFLKDNQMSAINLVKAALPPLKVMDLKTGSLLDLDQHTGQWSLLNIWATWCHACQEEMPSLELLQQKLLGRLKIIALSVDEDMASVKQFIKAHNPVFSIYWDQGHSIPSLLGLKKYPETFLISPEGLLITQFSGPRDWASKMAIDHLERAMAKAANK